MNAWHHAPAPGGGLHASPGGSKQGRVPTRVGVGWMYSRGRTLGSWVCAGQERPLVAWAPCACAQGSLVVPPCGSRGKERLSQSLGGANGQWRRRHSLPVWPPHSTHPHTATHTPERLHTTGEACTLQYTAPTPTHTPPTAAGFPPPRQQGEGPQRSRRLSCTPPPAHHPGAGRGAAMLVERRQGRPLL